MSYTTHRKHLTAGQHPGAETNFASVLNSGPAHVFSTVARDSLPAGTFSMVHDGPFPATTSLGTTEVCQFLMPASDRNCSEAVLPEVLV